MRPSPHDGAVCLTVERLCLYEWATAGGLDGPEGHAVTTDSGVADAVRQEGLAMLTALAGEAAASSRFTTRVLLGAGVPFSPPAGVSVVRIPRGREGDGLLTAASASDWLVVVAPETAGILARRLHSLSSRGCRLASPTAAFAALAADKQATMLALAAAGVPVPAGRLLRAGSCPPPGFRLPMVRKRVDSTGCDGLVMIESPTDAGGPAVHDERLEASVEWLPVSVSLLCGKACLLPLPPVIQQFSQGRSPAYLGGRLPVPASLVPRAHQLAVRAIRAMARASQNGDGGPAPAAGWVGVDMILADREDGRGDRVLEINPRVTTSLVGLAQCSKVNLIDAMILAAAGGVPSLAFRDLSTAPCEFAARPSSRSTLAEPT